MNIALNGYETRGHTRWLENKTKKESLAQHTTKIIKSYVQHNGRKRMKLKINDHEKNRQKWDSNYMITWTRRRGGEFIEGDEEHLTNTNDWITPHVVASNKYKHLHTGDGTQRQKKEKGNYHWNIRWECQT